MYWSGLLALAAEELGVLVLELVADVIHLAGGHGLLQDQGHGPGVADSLELLDVLLLGDPPVELGEREALLSAFASQRVREVLGELGGEVLRLVAREPLLQGFEGRFDGAFGLFAAVQLAHLLYPFDELVALQRAPFSSLPVPGTRAIHRINGGEEVAEKLYTELVNKGVEVLWDDRDESAGVKLGDADLIGIPIRLVVSKRNGEQIEYKERSMEKPELLSKDKLLDRLLKDNK